MPVKSWTRNKPPTETSARGKATGLRLKAAWKQFRQDRPQTASVSAPSQAHASTFHQTKGNLGASQY